MSVTTRNPLRMAGAQLNSGGPNTGELLMTTDGGQRTFTVFSGGLITLGSGSQNPALVSNPGTGHAVIWSGQGRLNSVLAHQSISGTAAFLYDSNVAARSGVGTIPESGWAVLATIPANTIGSYGSLGAGPTPLKFGVPFTNGLAISCPSGAPGMTICWSPDVSPSVG